jgi:ABC-type transporter MlaC component
MRNIFLCAVLLFSFLLPIHSSVAASLEPKALVEFIFEKAADKNVANDVSRQSEINQNISFSTMARQALGAEATKRSEAELAWFDRTLTEIITRTVYPEAPKFLKSVKVSYREVKVDGENARVSSVVRNKGESTDVDYRLKQVAGAWRVVDIAIDGESWTQTIAEQVKKTLEKNKWAGLETRLNQRLNELRSGKKAKEKKI